jgi:hypothetical protein
MTLDFNYEILLASFPPSPILKIIAILTRYRRILSLPNLKSQERQPRRRTPLHLLRKLTFIPSSVKPIAKESGFQELEFYNQSINQSKFN